MVRKNGMTSLKIHRKYKLFRSTVHTAEERRQKFPFCRFPFAVNVMLNVSFLSQDAVYKNNQIA